ncbi:hypothetical protein C7S20_15580 [Christiangramia fulva]|uniref:Uncharacterized protein n=1 Tax=Christiangramia fulva TaxID=2126553 RepID=A0A2R3Z8F6_9FLAO|nr:hypothetical protein [Christiangramia fulva]AVR46570.1 hypothetical protein C7S20_15580 [Christiangramia fulva]
MEHEKNQHKPHKKPGPDLVLETTDRDPHGKLFYHPSIFTFAVIGAIVGGLIVAFLAWMVADGSWAVVGLGQMSSGNRGPGAFFGFVVGSGIGGLLGSVMGIRKMLRLSPPLHKENQQHKKEKN